MTMTTTNERAIGEEGDEEGERLVKVTRDYWSRLVTPSELDRIKAEQFKAGWDAGAKAALEDAVPAPTEASYTVEVDGQLFTQKQWEAIQRYADHLAPRTLLPVPAPRTQDGEALEDYIHEAMIQEAMIETEYHDGNPVEVIAKSYVADVVPALARDLAEYGVRRPRTTSQDGEAREALVEIIECDLRSDDDQSFISDQAKRIADAILTHYTLVPVSPEGGETK